MIAINNKAKLLTILPRLDCKKPRFGVISSHAKTWHRHKTNPRFLLRKFRSSAGFLVRESHEGVEAWKMISWNGGTVSMWKRMSEILLLGIVSVVWPSASGVIAPRKSVLFVSWGHVLRKNAIHRWLGFDGFDEVLPNTGSKAPLRQPKPHHSSIMNKPKISSLLFMSVPLT